METLKVWRWDYLGKRPFNRINRRNNMPKVGKKKFPYTKKGKKAAKSYAKKYGKKVKSGY